MNYDKVSEVQIILTGTALRNARREVRKNKAAALATGSGIIQRVKAFAKAYMETRYFKGPRFTSNANNHICVAIGAATVNVGWSNGGKAGEYIYPLNTVGRIKTIAA